LVGSKTGDRKVIKTNNMETMRPKCYLVVEKVWEEPHNFEQSKVFLVKEEAEEYAKELKEASLNNYTYVEVLELDYELPKIIKF
jgi:hypothetical protein